MVKKYGIRALCALVLVIATMLSLSLFVSAEEVAEPVDPTYEEAPESSAEGSATLIGRIWEYVEKNAGELISALSVFATSVFLMYQKGKNNSLVLGLGKVLSGQKGVISASNINKEATAEMIDNQKVLMEYYKEYSKNEGDRNKITSVLLVEVMSLIEIQHVVCLNNKNMPQAIKNLVTSKYARCLSAINDDKELKAAYEEMRKTLGLATSEVVGNEASSS